MTALYLSLLISTSGAVHAVANADAPKQPPNILLIVADDLGWNSVGYHGGPFQTPHLDRLARRGVTLERFYVSPMCSPTRAGLLTGRYPMRFGMARSVIRPWMPDGLPTTEQTLAELLAEAGYQHRGCFGKWHLGHLSPQWHPLAQGFTAFKGQYNGAADYWTRRREEEVDWHINHAPCDEKGYTTDLIADAAVQFIREHADDEGPFFCYVPFTAPHEPLQAPPVYLAQYAGLDDNPDDGKPSELQTLAAMVTCMDDAIGRMLVALEETGAARDTLVWFMSDNGGVTRFPNVNRPLREGKLTVYEGGVRVPSVVYRPGCIEGGREVTVPLSNIDVMPTLLRVAGADNARRSSMDGIDMLDVLTGRAGTLPPRDLYCFHGQGGLEKEQAAIISADDWKLVVIGPDIRRAEGFLTTGHRVELFNLANDPCEEKDLSARHPERVADLGRRLLAFRHSEPARPMATRNRPPRGFKPPTHWRNAPATQPASAPAASLEPSDRPNILFVLIDDMGYGDLSCYGGSRVETVEIDRLASEGIRFTQFYVNAPICSPSRVALTTGQYPNRWKITSYLASREEDRKRGLADWLPLEAPSLARILSQAGYHAAHVGKWHMGGQRDVADAPPIGHYGFAASVTNFEGLGERILPVFEPHKGGKPFNHGPTLMSADLGGGTIHWVDRHKVTEAFVDRAIGEIRTAGERDRPFYINLWLDDVHTPMQAPPNLRGDGSPEAHYLGVIREMDRQLGRIFGFIRSQTALRDNTIILLASDNGPELGFGVTGGLRGGKATLYEGGIRSPLIVWYAGLPASAVSSTNQRTVVAGIDVPTSLLALAKVTAPTDIDFDGLNMAEALVGRSSPKREQPIMWVRPPDRPGPRNNWPDLAIRDGDWKLLLFRDGSKPQLFNVIDDPRETANLADRHPQMVEQLSERVIGWDKTIRETVK